MLQQQPTLGFTFSFQDYLMPHLAAILNGYSIGSANLAAEQQATWQIMSNAYFWDGDGVGNVTLRL